MENYTGIETRQLLKIYYSKYEIAYKIINKKVQFTNKELDFENMQDLDFVIYTSDFETMLNIKKVLVYRLNLLNKSWLKNCYHYTFKDFLNSFGMSQYNYNRLLKLSKDI